MLIKYIITRIRNHIILKRFIKLDNHDFNKLYASIIRTMRNINSSNLSIKKKKEIKLYYKLLVIANKKRMSYVN